MHYLGKDFDEIIVPPAAGRGFIVEAGQAFRVVDIDGQQVVDLVAVALGDLSEVSSPAQTLIFNHPKYRLALGDHFYSNKHRPMLEIIQDDTGGVHDLMFAACNGPWYASVGHPGHPNCADNLRHGVSEVQSTDSLALPDPINLFQDSRQQADGTIKMYPAATNAGESVTLRAAITCIIGVSTCAYDLEDERSCVNGAGPTPVRIEAC